MWHYVEGEETRGPVNPAAMAALIENRTVKPDTLVWREGFADWTPAAEAEEWAHTFPAAAGGLQLRTTRAYQAATEDDENEAISVNDLRAPLDAMAEAENTPPESTWLGWMLFTSPAEFRLFLFTAVLAGIATLGLKFYDSTMLPVPFMLQGLLCLGLGGLIFRVRTFQSGVGWGLAGLFIGVTDLVFIFTHWPRAKASVCLQLAGLAVMAGVFFAGASLRELMETVPLAKF